MYGLNKTNEEKDGQNATTNPISICDGLDHTPRKTESTPPPRTENCIM